MSHYSCEECSRPIGRRVDECISCGRLLCDRCWGTGDDDPPLCGDCAHEYYVEELGRVTLSETT